MKLQKSILAVVILISALANAAAPGANAQRLTKTYKPDLSNEIFKLEQHSHRKLYSHYNHDVTDHHDHDVAARHNVSQIPPSSQSVYVNLGGSDSTGDGSNTNPYHSIAFALSTITDAAATKIYTIEVGAGRFVESSLVLKPWVYIVGRNYEATKIAVSTAPKLVTLDSSFANGGTRAGLANVYLVSSTGISFDLATIGGSPTPSAVLSLTSVWIGGALSILGRPQGIDFVETYDIFVFGSVTYDSLNVQSQGSVYLSPVTLSAEVSTNTAGTHIGTYSADVVSVSSSVNASNLQEFVSSTLNGGLTTSGSQTVVQVDAISLPSSASLTIESSSQVTLSSGARTLEYIPSNPSHWASPAPVHVQEALDRLAAALAAPLP